MRKHETQSCSTQSTLWLVTLRVYIFIYIYVYIFIVSKGKTVRNYESLVEHSLSETLWDSVESIMQSSLHMCSLSTLAESHNQLFQLLCCYGSIDSAMLNLLFIYQLDSKI